MTVYSKAAIDELLTCLSEEHAESVQATCKALRHGLDSNWAGRLQRTNREDIERELGQVLAVMDMLVVSGVLSLDRIENARRDKCKTIQPFLNEPGSIKAAKQARTTIEARWSAGGE
jgi:hypothetical protein